MDGALIVGLGNPGVAYGKTRHNVGYMVIDVLCARLRSTFRPTGNSYEVAQGEAHESGLCLVKPTTYMNLSGRAVAEAQQEFGMPGERMLIVLDDFQLPLGTLRLRPKGSDGGHNGLASVIAWLGTEEIPRLRCGIGRELMPPKDAKREFVLEPFEAGEFPLARDMVQRAADAAYEFAASGINRAMTLYNTT